MPYPQEEVTTNGTNYTAGVALLGGPDNYSTRLWWDCNPAIN